MMEAGSDCKNVICARYGKYDQSSHMLELLTTSSWEFLLNRVIHDFMVYLLQHTLIFLPFPGQKHQQVSGPPLFIKQNNTLIIQKNKRKKEDNVQPSNKRHRFSSAVHVCPEVKNLVSIQDYILTVGESRRRSISKMLTMMYHVLLLVQTVKPLLGMKYMKEICTSL